MSVCARQDGLSVPRPSVFAMRRESESDDVVQVDCDTCEVRGLACGDCVVTYLLGSAPAGVELDARERAALEVLAASGLVPPLRLVPAASSVTMGHRGPGSGNASHTKSDDMKSAG
jgi:hypothetical protein